METSLSALEQAIRKPDRVIESAQRQVARLHRAGSGSVRRMEAVVAQKVSWHRDPAALAECLQLDFDATPWPDCVLGVFRDWLESKDFRGDGDLETFRAFEAVADRAFGVSGLKTEKLKSHLRGSQPVRAMFQLCERIPDDLRKIAYGMWARENRHSVLLHLLCFPDFRKLATANPVLARAWALSENGMDPGIWTDPALRARRKAELGEGARAILRNLGFPGNRGVLRVFAKQGWDFDDQWSMQSIDGLRNRPQTDFDRLQRTPMPIPDEILSRLVKSPVWPSPELLSVMIKSKSREEIGLFEDCRSMMEMAGVGTSHLSRIRTFPELEEFHDRWVARINRPGFRRAPVPFEVEPPFQPARWMRAITNADDLLSAARRFRNCATAYGTAIRQGRYAIYVAGGLAMVGLRRTPGSETWGIDQISGIGNTPVPRRVAMRVRTWLRLAQRSVPGGQE